MPAYLFYAGNIGFLMVHIRKFTRQYNRRLFLEKMKNGLLTAGLYSTGWLSAVTPNATASVYPDELADIGEFTHGVISSGDYIDSNNVEQVQALVNPVMYQQIKEMGRKVRVLETVSDIYQLSPKSYIDATLTNLDKAKLTPEGNVLKRNGSPWVNGIPFPNAKKPIEVVASSALAWGRHLSSSYAIKESDLGSDGALKYSYEIVWSELNVAASAEFSGLADSLNADDYMRLQAVLFVSPSDIKGTSYLNHWYHDQRKFPNFYGYLPAFKRIRRLPSSQRFEPLIPGSNLYLSDAWSMGDPYLTWGGFKVIYQGPMLGSVSRTWNSEHPNWEHTTHGGEKGISFWDTNVEIIPEVIAIEMRPTSYPTSPIGRKVIWYDLRTMLPISMVTYDRKDQIFRYFDGSYSLYTADEKSIQNGNEIYWSWTRVHAHDLQTNSVTRMQQVKNIRGGHHMMVDDSHIYHKYLTKNALIRNGM